MKFTVVEEVGFDDTIIRTEGLTAWEMLSMLGPTCIAVWMHKDDQTTDITLKIREWFGSNEELDEFLAKL